MSGVLPDNKECVLMLSVLREQYPAPHYPTTTPDPECVLMLSVLRVQYPAPQHPSTTPECL